ncbi:YggS family pyridoxal phosphate-dependent enzyme [soil metagenome]
MLIVTPDVRTILECRLAAVRDRMAAACLRSRRNVSDVTLVAVTKTVTPDVAAIIADLGLFDLGESRPQELWKKQAVLPTARFHFIGHLQRNKLERTVPLCMLIHSVDSQRLLEALNAFGVQRGSPVPVLLEVNCSREEAKGGFAPEAVLPLADTFATWTGLRIDGLMTMAAYHDDPELCRPAFVELRSLRDSLQARTRLPLATLSMGMSHDFEIAIEEGATHIRVGSTLFADLPAAGS